MNNDHVIADGICFKDVTVAEVTAIADRAPQFTLGKGQDGHAATVTNKEVFFHTVRIVI
jgi:hypothetical protein